MKKILTMLVLSAIALSATFADQVMRALDFSVPIENKKYTLSGDLGDDFIDKTGVEAYGFNVNYDRMAVGDSGFSFIFGVGLGYDLVTLDFDGYGFDTNAFDLKVKFGWGGSPIHNDKMLLSIHGFTGLDLKAGTGSEHIDGMDFDMVLVDYSMPIGVDAVFGIKLSDCFGLTAGIDISTNIFGFGALLGEYEEKEEYYYTVSESTGDVISYVFNGFSITPKIGICWIVGD